jgi:thiol-disulfide isomerase/thioredoxin
MNRRKVVFGAVGGTALAAGATAAWLRHSTRGDVNLLGADFWSLRFEQPAGPELVMDSLRGAPLLLNFWATWCPPCIREMPLLDDFARQHQDSGWRVVGLAIDSPTPVREFLLKRPVSFPVGLAGLDGNDLAKRLGNPSGSLPFTVVVGRDAQVIDRKLGALKPEDLQRWVKLAYG